MNFGTRILVTRTLSATTTFINNLRGAYYCWIFESQYRKNILEQSIEILSGIDWDWAIEPNRISGSRSCLYQTKSTGRTSGQGFSRKHIKFTYWCCKTWFYYWKITSS